MDNAQSSEPANSATPDHWHSIDASGESQPRSLSPTEPTTDRPGAITRVQQLLMQFVPSALHSPAGKGGGRKGKHEKNSAIGNEETIPWSRPLRDRSVIRVTGYLDPVTIMTSSITVPAFGSSFFTFAMLDNATNLTAVFDEYHIAEIEVLIANVVTEVTPNSASMSTWVSAVDIDDAATPTSVAQVASYASSVESPGTMSHFHRWSPNYAVATYSGAFTSYSAARGWVDCASPAVQHYGIKCGTPQVSSASPYLMMSRMTVLLRGLH